MPNSAKYVLATLHCLHHAISTSLQVSSTLYPRHCNKCRPRHIHATAAGVVYVISTPLQQVSSTSYPRHCSRCRLRHIHATAAGVVYVISTPLQQVSSTSYPRHCSKCRPRYVHVTASSAIVHMKFTATDRKVSDYNYY